LPIAAGAPNGRKVAMTAITDGSISANGTAAYWATVDSGNSRLLASGSLDISRAVVSGAQFKLPSFSVTMPLTSSPDGPGIVVLGGLNVPDPLTLNNGKLVTSTAVWEGTRRQELLTLFRQNVYGYPLPNPDSMSFSVVPTDFGSVRRKIVTISITGPNGTLPLTLRMFIPIVQSPKPALFLQIDHRSTSTEDPTQSTAYSPVSQLNAQGFAYASIHINELAPDQDTADGWWTPAEGSWRSKMFDLFHGTGYAVADTDGRCISTWSWGASRAMDYMVTDPDIDINRIYVMGYSRSGKTALWTAAQDTRFRYAADTMGGLGSAKIARHIIPGGVSETITAINTTFPFWFPEAFRTYNDNEASLPVDQNELLALIAPRSVYVAAAVNDQWADPEGMFLGLIGAQRVYSFYMTPSSGITESNWPVTLDQSYADSAMGYHMRSGDHGLLLSDWQHYMDYAATFIPA
jgi:(4-O-methyl)-D-glucuronate---lignin esterase